MQLADERRVAARMRPRDGKHGGRRVDGGDAGGGGETRGRLGEDTATAADVEVAQGGRRRRLRCEAALDEVMPDGVHQVQEA